MPPDKLGAVPARSCASCSNSYGYRRRASTAIRPGLHSHAHRFRSRDARTASRNYRAFIDAPPIWSCSYGGSLSGEHGDGQVARPSCCRRCSAPELVQAFREFKAIWDPAWKMNPGKVVDAYQLDENLRLGAGLQPAGSRKTHFNYADDHGSFAHATLRCVGVGKCRRNEGGIDVPELPGDARRRALHARPRPPAVRDAARAR